MSEASGHEFRHALRFHSHAYFDHAVPKRVEEARAFRAHIARTFSANGHLEVRAFHAAPAGPHPLGSFEVLFTREAFAYYVPWLMFARPQGIDILVHPVTGSQVLDHTARALWLGAPQPLDRRMLEEEDVRRLASGAMCHNPPCAPCFQVRTRMVVPSGAARHPETRRYRARSGAWARMTVLGRFC